MKSYELKGHFRSLVITATIIMLPKNIEGHEKKEYISDTTEIRLVEKKAAVPCEKDKRPWNAAVQTFGINAGVWAFDRYILNADFAKISINSVRENIKTGFVWDNDKFSTNLFAHPYHGSLYFNTARSNGLNFWESIPYSFGGSLMWEIAAETEPPAINDFVATAIGGMALGEVTHRLSNAILNDSKKGMQRFWRETIATLINPIGGINRIVTGRAWKIRNDNCDNKKKENNKVNIDINIGERYLADDDKLFKGSSTPYIRLKCTYGNPFDKENNNPYDFFDMTAAFSLTDNQPLINRVNLLGLLWNKTLYIDKQMEAMVGIFQHFNYFDSSPVLTNSQYIPYKISEAASIGPGVIINFPKINKLFSLGQSLHLSGILLGGGLTDYYNVIDRNYNLGSGYSIKNTTLVDFGAYGRFFLNIQLYQIFTWKGYEQKKAEVFSDPLHLNSQGDKGNILLGIVNPEIELRVRKNIFINFGLCYYHRHTHYSYHDDKRFKTLETRMGVTLKL
jgi:hypothetical protein